jgi:chorismate synthase
MHGKRQLVNNGSPVRQRLILRATPTIKKSSETADIASDFM